MSVFGRSSAPADEDIACAACGTPLLSRKSVCPRCGARGTTASPATSKSASAYVPDETDVYTAGGYSPSKDDLLTVALVFTAGIGLLYSVLNLFLGSFGLDDMYRSFMAAFASLGLLGLRRLLL